MAAAVLVDRFRQRNIPGVVESAGVAALVGRPADPLAVELMRSRGLDLGGHRARQVTPELVHRFDLVLVMERGQQHVIEAMDPRARGRVHRIGKLGGFDVPDPHGLGPLAFERSLALVERGLRELEPVFWAK